MYLWQPYFFFSALYSATDDLRPCFVIKWRGTHGMTVHHDNPQPDPETTEKPEGFCTAGNGRKECTRKGGDMGTRLGSSAQLGTAIATFSADGAHHLSEENHLIRTMRCVLGLEPRAKTSALSILLGPPPTTCLSATYTRTHTIFRNQRLSG